MGRGADPPISTRARHSRVTWANLHRFAWFQLAVGDADLIIMPFRRRLVAFYTVQPMVNRRFTLKTEGGLRVINAALCRNAVKGLPAIPTMPGKCQTSSGTLTDFQRLHSLTAL
jgi:hypothetical protein